jgi:SAM-dependent methyltransferase
MFPEHSMPSDLKGRIEDSLRDIRYHPEFSSEADGQLKAFVEKCQESGQLQSMMQEIRCRANDAVLMRETFFPARLEFLSRLLSYLGERPEAHLSVAEDGCGTGVDLYVLDALLKDKLTLTGIDKSESALAIARNRVPRARFLPDFDGASYDLIYSDFVAIDGNLVWEIGERGKKNFDALCSPGIVLQNADMKLLRLYCTFFGQRFSKIVSPELLAEIPNGPDCYLCRFEKK